jgi:LacI family transcriptional regulator
MKTFLHEERGRIMVNITDIANQLGVSPSMVSRVINGKGYVHIEKRQQILKLVKETGYVPNKAARNMATGRSYNIGVVIPDTFNIFQRQLFSIIERHLNTFGYHTLFLFVKFDSTSENDCLDRLKSEKVDGVIMLHEIKNQDFYEYLAKMNLPLISTMCNYNDVPTVKIDDKKAAFDGITHLTSLGHTKIVMICGDGFSFGHHRVEGYLQALDESGITRDEKRIIYVQQYTPESGMYGMRELLLRSKDFSAVFTASDELALGALRILQDEGIRIPEDVSLLGFDDIDIASYLHPRLTTVRQPLGEIAEQTTLSLYRCINDGTAMPNSILPHRLIIRESTCAPFPQVYPQ